MLVGGSPEHLELELELARIGRSFGKVMSASFEQGGLRGNIHGNLSSPQCSPEKQLFEGFFNDSVEPSRMTSDDVSRNTSEFNSYGKVAYSR